VPLKPDNAIGVTATADSSRARGFTLIELAVALVVISAVLGSILVPLTTQVEQRKIGDTQRTLDQAMEALLGFAASNGRLPCPASATSNGIEDPVGGGNCNHPFDGFFPAATLGLSPTDAQGYLVDAWGLTQNRIRYAVSNNSSACSNNVFTTTGGMKSCWSSTTNPSITAGTLTPTLNVCSTATGIASNNCAAGAVLANTAPAVIFSLGKNAATGGTGADEAENLDGDRAFVWHTPSGTNAPNGEFDDIMVWMSPNILYSWMIRAGQLP
jgi:prepilin-type N-terminal cleavage/methylation domain-containing protein